MFFPRASAATTARSTRPDVTLSLDTALVISRLDYTVAVSLIAGLPATTVAALHDHMTSALKELHWLPIKQRVDCLLVHKVTVRQAPLTGMLTAVAEVPSLSTLRDASNGNYVIPRTRLKFGERAFSVAAPRAWNRLPSANRTQADAFHAGFQTFLENVLVLDMPTVPSSGIALLTGYLMRRRSSCRRRTKSTVDYDYDFSAKF